MRNFVLVEVLNSLDNLLEIGAGLVFTESEWINAYFFYLMIWRKSYPLGKNYVTKSKLFFVSIISYRLIIFLWLIFFKIYISFFTLLSSLGRIFALSMIFMATFSLVGICMPRCTFPNEPCPIFLPIFHNQYLEGSCQWFWHLRAACSQCSAC